MHPSRRPAVTGAARHRGRLCLLSGVFAAIAAIALATPLSASAASAATWRTHVFSISYDASGTFSYNAEGTNGDSGCHMAVGEGARYSFGQLWTIRVGFKRVGPGRFQTKVESVTHVDGPQGAVGKHGASHLKGKQTALPDENCADGTIVPDTGTYDCTSSTVTLTAFPNPQMEVSRQASDLVLLGRAFLDGHWKFTGTDTIPSDKKGCATYDDDLTYGSDLLPGLYATAKVSLPVKQLAGLAKGKSVTKPVSFGKNTEFPPQKTCDAVFGTPNSCVINSQNLTGKFKLIKVS